MLQKNIYSESDLNLNEEINNEIIELNLNHNNNEIHYTITLHKDVY